MSPPPRASETLPPSPWGHAPFRRYLASRLAAEFAAQMTAVAVGWQLYALTGSALALGLVGLAQFLPTLLLTLIAGHVADRYDRRRVLCACLVVAALITALLALGSLTGTLGAAGIFAAVAVLGAAAAFENSAAAALLPAVTPRGQLAQASAWSTSAFQFATIAGPAFGGLAYALAPGLLYGAVALLWGIAACLFGAARPAGSAPPQERPDRRELFAGVHFVRREPTLLGMLTLDLAAVLLGGVTALLPIYARDILHTGPAGLGLLRAAPAAGALLLLALLVRHPLVRRVGLRLFQAVIVFGLATVGFALSGLLWVSVLMLAILGAADAVSMVIRATVVQLATPEGMRGRVGAVNALCAHSAGQLGEFESGLAAALLGAVPAALIGGLGTIVVALAWMRWFPQLRHLDSLWPRAPEATAPVGASWSLE